jgi:hypothetical protein
MYRNTYAGFKDFYQISMAINELSGMDVYTEVYVYMYICIEVYL